jgi:radical SAM superfamily enzyme YgiQ (UPF0313 family)
MQRKSVLLLHVSKLRLKGRDTVASSINIPAMGLFSIANFLNRSGIPTEVMHLQAEGLQSPSSVVDRVSAIKPDLIGISLHWHALSYEAIKTARFLKKRFKATKVVLGGATASYYCHDILRSCQFIDFVIRGDGEVPMRDLVLSMEGKKEISEVPNLVYRDSKSGTAVENATVFQADGSFLDSLDFVGGHLYAKQGYDSRFFHCYWLPKPATREKMHFLCIGRGCRYNCVYCSGAKSGFADYMHRKHTAFRSYHRVFEDIVYLHGQDVRLFYIGNDPFSNEDDRDAYFLSLFDKIRQSGLKIGMRFDHYGAPSERFLDAFAKTFDQRASSVHISLETTDLAIRKRYKVRPLSLRGVRASLLVARDRGISIGIFLAVLPGESWESVYRTTGFLAPFMRANMRIQADPIEVEPGSEWFGAQERYGVGPVDVSFGRLYKRHRDNRRLFPFSDKELGVYGKETGAKSIFLNTFGAFSYNDFCAGVDADLVFSGKTPKGHDALFNNNDIVCLYIKDIVNMPRFKRWLLANTLRPLAVVYLSAKLFPLHRTLFSLLANIKAELCHVGFIDDTANGAYDNMLDNFNVSREGDYRLPASLDEYETCMDPYSGSSEKEMDACKVGTRPCPLPWLHRVILDGTRVSGCMSGAVAQGPLADLPELRERVLAVSRQVQARRGCAACDAREPCPKCIFPAPATEAQYCAFIRARQRLTT